MSSLGARRPMIERQIALRRELLRRQAKARHAQRGGLIEFVKYFWHVLEPKTPFVDGWAIRAICEHLEAVTFGDINRILANVPPGFSKSLISNVFHPAWEWGPMNLPHLRSIAFSYAAHLTERDNGKFRDLIRSTEYQTLYGDRFTLTSEGVEKVANDKTGWRYASSVGGVGTGERADRVVCLPHHVPVLTNIGWLPIGTIVERKLDVQIAGRDDATGHIEWQAIEAYEKNPGRPIVRIAWSGGALECTPEHPVFVSGRGYVAASEVGPGNTILWAGGAFDLHQLRIGNFDARREEVAGETETRVVETVEVVGWADAVYNVRVTPHHNYFAAGVLVHNCDDPHNIKDGESDTIRTKTVRWFDEAMSNRLNDLRKSAIIVIMQRVHEADVSGHIIENEPDYCHLMVPMCWDGRRYTTDIGWTDPRSDDGELAWPERYPEETLSRFKRNAFLWSGQYQQAPEPRGGGLFKRDWWRYEEVPIGKQPPQLEYIVASLDSAYTKQERNDPSGFTVWGIYRDANGNPKVLLLHAWRKHLELHGPEIERKRNEPERLYVDRAKKQWGLVEWVAYDCKRLRVDRLLIESKASGMSVAQEMTRLYANEGWGVELVNPEGDKYARAVAVVHLWADGFVHVPASRLDPNDADSLAPRDWAQLVIDEMAIFPNGRFRDLTDASTQALRHLRMVGLAVRREEREDDRIAKSMHREKLPPLYHT